MSVMFSPSNLPQYREAAIDPQVYALHVPCQFGSLQNHPVRVSYLLDESN
jgi:hypothetical protein